MLSKVRPEDTADYALSVADASYVWYRIAAIRSRRNHRISAVALNVLAAAIPVSAVVLPGNVTVPAILGAAIVVVSGLRAIFDWQENYLRFSGAREAVEAERRLYLTYSPPYDKSETRQRFLVAAVTKVERDEMTAWFDVASDQPRT